MTDAIGSIELNIPGQAGSMCIQSERSLNDMVQLLESDKTQENAPQK
ncbi:MAG: hypothetical protein ABIJ59_01840 [Pseudomonadota bacterium]